MKNYLLTIALISVVISLPGKSQTLQEVIDTALVLSPELKMMEAKVNASANRVEQNTNLPDPMFSFGFMNLPTSTFSFNEEPMTMAVVGLSQEFPFPGKLSAAADVNRKDVAISKQEYYDIRNDLVKKVSQSYYELQFIREEKRLLEEQINLMKDISEVVNVMYSVSEASQQNLLRIDLEISNMYEMLSEVKGEESEKLSTLNAFLFRDSNSKINTDQFPIIYFTVFTLNELESVAKQNRPYLIGVNQAIEKAKLNQSVAEYDYYPMFKIWAQYGFRGEIESTGMDLDNMLSFMVDVSIPLNYGGKVTAMVEENVSMQQMYEEQYSTSLQMLRREFGMILAKLNSLEERIKLIEQGSLIQARENLKTSFTSYQVGEIDFMSVIEAQNNLYSLEKNLYALKTDYLNQVAELEFLTGTNLSKE